MIDASPRGRTSDERSSRLPIGGAAVIERVEERRTGIAVAEEGVYQFKVADGHVIELKAIGAFIETDAVDMV